MATRIVPYAAPVGKDAGGPPAPHRRDSDHDTAVQCLVAAEFPDPGPLLPDIPAGESDSDPARGIGIAVAIGSLVWLLLAAGWFFWLRPG